jgi:hypothetical protein
VFAGNTPPGSPTLRALAGVDLSTVVALSTDLDRDLSAAPRLIERLTRE